MNGIELRKVKSAYFIGIGGIGISAIARMFLLDGKKVSGSDRSRSLITDELLKAGAKISIGHDEANVCEADLVVYTIAISENNPEFAKAKILGLPMLSYPEVLGLISKDKFTISIAGTHGKTTTTAMAGKLMLDAGLDPTVIVGSLMKVNISTGGGQASNIMVGKSNYFVVESCEYHRSFLNISPKIIIVTNIDNDHLDYYKDLEDIQGAFSEFVSKLGPEDYLITDARNGKILPVVGGVGCRVIDYQDFSEVASGLKLRVPGRHNIENAKAVLALSTILKIDPSDAINSLNNFAGTWRRFEFKGHAKNGAEVYDDYGHHPTEVMATLRGAREHFGNKKIVTIFQPHLYSRTKLLLKDFARSFGDTDDLILLPIYAARETADPSISSEILANEIRDSMGGKYEIKDNFLKTVVVVTDRDDAISRIDPSAEVVVTLGAGDVTTISDSLTNQ